MIQNTLRALALTVALTAAPLVVHAQTPSGGDIVVHNAADDFLRFWDATRDLPTAERVTIFKRDVAPLFPAFYGIERYNGQVTQEQQDQRFARAIEAFAPLRDRFAATVQAFDTDLDRNITTFRAAFPDFQSTADIYLVHSVNEMNAGTRTLDGRQYLVFGADGMVRYPQPANILFHHELFHVLHQQTFNGCREIWCNLWLEGLATYVSEQLNPGSALADLLPAMPLNLASDTDAHISEAWAQLDGSLTVADRDLSQSLFMSRDDGTGLPARRGYYLGYLIARELGRTRTVQDLAGLTVDEARPLVIQAVADMRARAS